MSQEFATFHIGDKEFKAAKMNAFAAAKHLVKLKTLLDKGLASGGDANAIQLLAGIDEKTLEDVIIPILRDSSTFSVTDEKKIDSPNAMNLVFTVFFGGLGLVQALKSAVMTFIQTPVAYYRDPHQIHFIEHDPQCSDGSFQY